MVAGQSSKERASVESRTERSLSPSRQSRTARAVIICEVTLYRDGLALALSAQPSISVKGLAGTATEALDLLVRENPDIVLLDAGMRDLAGLCETLSAASPSVRIIVFALGDDDRDVVACAEAGVSAYAPHDASVNDLVGIIHSAIKDELVISPRAAASVWRRLGAVSVGNRQNGHPILSKRELTIVELIDQGLTNKEIAQRLRLGTSTVKNHVHRILEKLGVYSCGEAAASIRRPQAHRTQRS